MGGVGASHSKALSEVDPVTPASCPQMEWLITSIAVFCEDLWSPCHVKYLSDK